MANTYDTIMDALLATLRTQCGDTFSTYSRFFRAWEDVFKDNVQMPALYLYDGMGFGGGRITFQERGRGLPPVRTMHRTIVVYARYPYSQNPQGSAPKSPGGPVLHPLVASIEAAFAYQDRPSVGPYLTLGGLVSHCWIEGDVMTVTPDIDPEGRGMLTVPVMIMIP